MIPLLLPWRTITEAMEDDAIESPSKRFLSLAWFVLRGPELQRTPNRNASKEMTKDQRLWHQPGCSQCQTGCSGHSSEPIGKSRVSIQVVRGRRWLRELQDAMGSTTQSVGHVAFFVVGCVCACHSFWMLRASVWQQIEFWEVGVLETGQPGMQLRPFAEVIRERRYLQRAPRRREDKVDSVIRPNGQTCRNTSKPTQETKKAQETYPSKPLPYSQTPNQQNRCKTKQMQNSKTQSPPKQKKTNKNNLKQKKTPKRPSSGGLGLGGPSLGFVGGGAERQPTDAAPRAGAKAVGKGRKT